MNIKHATLSFTVAAITLLAIGCSSEEKPKLSINDYFEQDSETRSVDKIFAQQHANGARQDGLLYPAHFTDGELNSLGKQKLDLATAGPERGQVSLYLNIPKDAIYGARESSVIAYLSHKGLASNSYSLTAGDNPAVGAPAIQGLNGLAKQSTGDAGAGAAAPAASK